MSTGNPNFRVIDSATLPHFLVNYTHVLQLCINHETRLYYSRIEGLVFKLRQLYNTIHIMTQRP